MMYVVCILVYIYKCIYLKSTLWVIRALGGEGFQFSRVFSLDVRIFTVARSGFSMELMELSLELSVKCSLQLPGDVIEALTGAFPRSLHWSLHWTSRRLRLRTSNVSAYAVLTFAYVKRKRLRCPYVS